MTDVVVDRAEPDPGTGSRSAPVATAGLVALATGAGVLLELGARGGAANALVTAGVVTVAVALVAGGRLVRREARGAAVAAVVPAAFLAVRSSPWLAWSNLAAVAVALSVAVLFSRSGSVVDTTVGRLVERVVAALRGATARLAAVRAAAARVRPGDHDHVVRFARGLLVAVPLLVVLVALLASADAVFAAFLTPDVDVVPVAGHVLPAALVAAVVLALAAMAATPLADRERTGSFGVTEVVTMLTMAAAILGLFVVAQLVALTDAGERVVESAGLTPAEYARSGFFQLCWATGLVLAFLGIVHALAGPRALAHPVVRGLGAVVPALAVGLVVVSLRRMALYDRAFGLTMLRLWVVGAALWMGSVLVMTVVRNLRPSSGRRWLVSGALLSAFALVLAADLADPEAFVARHNLERAREGAELDVRYLAGLSDDAVPAIAGEIREGEAGGSPRVALSAALRCGDDATGAAALNRAAARAADVRRELCPQLGGRVRTFGATPPAG